MTKLFLVAAVVVLALVASCSRVTTVPAAIAPHEDQIQIQPELVVTAPVPEPPLMDTVVVTAVREANIGTASADEPRRSAEAVTGAGSGSAVTGRKPVTGHAHGIQPGVTNPSFPFYPQRIEP
jgi:hypothetical protein